MISTPETVLRYATIIYNYYYIYKSDNLIV